MNGKLKPETELIFAHRDVLILAHAMASGTYPVAGQRLSRSLQELHTALTQARAPGELIEALKGFCTADAARHQLWAAVRDTSATEPIPPRLADVYDWRIYDMTEARKPRAPLHYIVNSLLATPSLNIVYGSPGSLKSMLVADCAVCVGSGLQWLPPVAGQETELAAIPTTQTPVFWIDYDNGKRRTDERLDALDRARGAPVDSALYYTVMSEPWLDAMNAAAITTLSWRIRELAVGLVVIDNLGAVLGSADENSSAMAQVMRNFRTLVEATGAAVVVIHHQRKFTGGGKMGDDLRGHSSIRAALDLALLVEREGHEPYIGVRSTKTRGVDVYPFGAYFTYEHAPGTRDLYTARFFGAAIQDDTSFAAIERAIGDVVRDAPGIKQSDLIEQVKEFLPGAGLNKIRNHIKFMVDTNKLEERHEANNAKTYYIPEG